MEFADVVARRRMVRHFSAEPVDRVVLERIAATAQRTPSAGFSQGQRLVIVTDPNGCAAWLPSRTRPSTWRWASTRG